MKKIYSLVNACMSSDMHIFKIYSKKKNKIATLLFPLFIGLYLMFAIYMMADGLFEKIAPMHIQYIILSLSIFGISIMTIIEGIYKTGPILFNCKDDQLLLSLPIKKQTVLFVRILKFYIFEFLFNSLFLLPIIVVYIKWADVISWTYFLTSIVMLLLSPIIPIIISCLIGSITSSISSRFKFKNFVQIIISMIFILGMLLISYNMDSIFNYLVKHANSLNDFITKLYYPAGVYAKLVTDFSFLQLLVFILVNVGLLSITIWIISKFYFKINSRLKNVSITKKLTEKKIVIKQRNITCSLIRKELNTFFKTPVFIINAGFSLLLFIIMAVAIAIKSDSIISLISSSKDLNISKDLIINNLSLIIFFLITFGAFMTSITNSVISLEGKNFNILKSLPLKTKTILMSKIYSSLVLTTPVLLIGTIIMIIKLKISIVEAMLLICLTIIMPLVSHFIGIIVNLKHPKLDYENSAEVVKQSASSFISVMVGMILLIITIYFLIRLINVISSTFILLLFMVIYLVIDIILYVYLISKGSKSFNKLSV